MPLLFAFLQPSFISLSARTVTDTQISRYLLMNFCPNCWRPSANDVRLSLSRVPYRGEGAEYYDLFRALMFSSYPALKAQEF